MLFLTQPAISRETLRSANKVAMQMRFAATVSDHVAATRIVRDSQRIVLELLDRIDPIEFRAQFEHHTMLFVRRQRTDEAWNQNSWHQVHVDHSEWLRSQGFQERLIAELGTEMGNWNFDFVNLDCLADAMDRLGWMCSTGQKQMITSMVREDLPDMLTSLGNALCGLALFISASESNEVHASEGAYGRQESAAVAMFGANYLVQQVGQLAVFAPGV